MAKKRSYSVVGGGGHPRANWWKNQLGVDYYRGGQGYSEEYQAVLDRATALGYTQPSDAQKTKQDMFLRALKTGGVWDLLDILYVFATDGDLNYATINWKAPTLYKCTLVNSPTKGAAGFTFNGSTNYLNPGWVPSTNGVKYTLNSAGVFLHENTNVATGTAATGVLTDSSSRYILITPKSNTNNLGYAINSNVATSTVSIGVESSIGLTLVNRVSSSEVNAYKNGVLKGTDAAQTVGAAVPSRTPFIGARNNAGVADAFRASQISCFGAGANLTSVQSVLYTAWNTYFTSL